VNGTIYSPIVLICTRSVKMHKMVSEADRILVDWEIARCKPASLLQCAASVSSVCLFLPVILWCVNVKMILYTAIPRKTSQLRLVHQYLANKIVLSVCQKTPLLTAGSRSSTGSEFQTVGPLTEKACQSSALWCDCDISCWSLFLLSILYHSLLPSSLCYCI